MTRVLLVDAEHHPVLLALQVGEALEVSDRGHHMGERRNFGHRFGDQIVMLHRGHRMVDPDHVTHLAGPEPCGIHDMLGDHRALLGIEPPQAIGRARDGQHPVVKDDVGPAQPRCARVGVRRAMRIEIALVRIEEASHQSGGFDDRDEIDDLVHVEHSRALRAHHRVPVELGPEPLHALWSAREFNAAGHPQTHTDAALGLDLRVEPDRVLLQGRDVSVAVDRVKATCRMPTRPGGELGALDDRDICPAPQGQVIEQAAPDDAAADNDDLVRRLHPSTP
ncbi:unannotated protein [freshwater metagenome]|uniref:Unannotated protein n=1 Tax=freshwater metagenome TaxID=449393 RepID=A0A6J7KRC8_9ZZZZ